MPGKMKDKIKSFYMSHTVGKLLISAVLLLAVIYVLFSIPVWSIKKTDIPKVSSRQPLEGESISNDAGKVVVAESDGKTLTLDTKTLAIELKDSEGGVFSSQMQGIDNGSEKALISVTYLGKDNNLYEWNSFDKCVEWGSYTLKKLENGVSIDMNLNENESTSFYEYLPKKCSYERFEEFFVGGIKSLKESGELEKDKADRYLKTLKLVYKKMSKEECYAVNYTGNPPNSAVKQLIEVAKLLGYDRQMLSEDADEFGFTVSFSEPAVFDIVLELTLENGELVAHIPTGACKSENDFYTIQNIKVLPNFGAVTADQYAEGKFLVPDGSGALVDFNSFKTNVKDYERPIYNNDYFKDYAFMPQYGEEINMPVFGAIYGPDASSEKGFLAIVEEGARNGYIHMKLASSGAESSKFNKLYASFDVAQFNKVKIYGDYSDDNASYLVNTGMQDMDLTLRYKFYGKKATYFDLAMGYRSYLEKELGLTENYDDGAEKLYLEVVGALNLTKRFVGIPYSSQHSMTDYKDLLAMMQDLEGKNFDIQYDGIFNDGWNGALFNGAELSKSNGSKKNFEKVKEYAKDHDIDLYLETSLTKIWQKGNGFRASRHALRDFANDEALFSRYMPAMGIFNYHVYDGLEHDKYYMLAPDYLDAITDRFLKKADKEDFLAVTDLAGMYYGDYRFNGFVSGEEGNRIIESNMEKLSEGRKLSLTNPHIDKIGYGSIAVDVSRRSSDYITFATTIPFKQLVMNGLIDYTTENVNLSFHDTEYYILQAAETGAIPKFILTYDNVDVLKNSDYSYLYSVQYDVVKDEIESVYEEVSKIRQKIGTSKIIGHETLMDGVYKTTYATGVSVTVNYNLYDVTIDTGTTLPSESYIMKEVQ